MKSKPQRQAKLEEYQKLHRLLLEEANSLREEYKKASNKLQRHNIKIRSVGQAIYDLKHDGQTPHITDHAIVRYLERVEGQDIDDLRLKVANHKRAIIEGNVVVTVGLEELL